MDNDEEIANELAKVIENTRPMFGDDDVFDAVLAIYRQNPLLKQMLSKVKKDAETGM